MKKRDFITLFLATLCLMGCELLGMDAEPHYMRFMRNNSNLFIFTYQAANTKDCPTVYPDTLLPVIFNTQENRFFIYENPDMDNTTDTLGIICPGTFREDYCSFWGNTHPRFQREYFEKEFPAGYYSVFILSYETYLEKGWEGIRDDYDILVRYDLTYDNLKALNDTIPFPPSEAMKEMKMWPPYEEVVSKYYSSF